MTEGRPTLPTAPEIADSVRDLRRVQNRTNSKVKDLLTYTRRRFTPNQVPAVKK